MERTGPGPEVQGYDGKPETTGSKESTITVLGHGVSVIDLLEHFRWFLLLLLRGYITRTRITAPKSCHGSELDGY